MLIVISDYLGELATLQLKLLAAVELTLSDESRATATVEVEIIALSCLITCYLQIFFRTC